MGTRLAHTPRSRCHPQMGRRHRLARPPPHKPPPKQLGLTLHQLFLSFNPAFPGPHYSPDPRLLPAHLVQAPALRPARLFVDDAAPHQACRAYHAAPCDVGNKNPATHCMTGIDGGSAGIRTRGGLHHTAFRVLHLRPLGHATSAAQFTGDYSQYANLTYPAAVT